MEGEKVGEVILTMKDIDKSFPGVHALKKVSLEVRRGEVHALMGENGAGKSTLMKILTGIYSKDSGQIIYEGKEVEFTHPREAQDAGIAIVHQELNMMQQLTVAQNIFIGREYMKGKIIDDKRMNEEAAKLFEKLNISIDPSQVMGDLTVGKQQMCEIAKAISKEVKVLVFDEPTAALTDSEINELFKIIRDLREKGIGIIYISHRMDEIKIITDRVTVMRDGEYVGTLISKDCTKDDIINMMVGRTIYEEPKSVSNVPDNAPVVLKVEHLQAGKMVQDISFELRKGEILGFSGLMGAGRTETARVIFGADKKQGGDIYVNGKKVGQKKFRKNCRFDFQVKYYDGEVTAVALDAFGKELSRNTLHTAGSETVLTVLPEKPAAKPGEVCFVRLRFTDAAGTVKPLEHREIAVTVEGGELLALGNACPFNLRGYMGSVTDTYYGEAMAVVRAGEEGFTLRATDGERAGEASVPAE